MNADFFWKTKLAARIHDPVEKALILLRDPAGHEGGTSRALKRLLGLEQLPQQIAPDNDSALAKVLFQQGLGADHYRHIQRADWWAAGADRPQWPVDTIQAKDGGETVCIKDWARVRWTEQPVLIHPLTGKVFDLRNLKDTDITNIKQRSSNHFSCLIVKDGDAVDWRRTLLAFWRFGPDLSVTGADTQDFSKLGELWKLLPADTRVPDHSIWDHLDLVSAFAGAFAADRNGECMLLALSLGPVQSFIAAARKMDDLWAGSHLLSRLSWEAMKPVCERLGADAILFPRLRGVPQVDLWLRDDMRLHREWFDKCTWTEKANDTNPLFSAALPNRFVAVVPASEAAQIAEEVKSKVRKWLLDKGLEVVDRLLEAAGIKEKGALRDESVHAYDQMRNQLAGFPEVHWAAVPFSLIQPRNAEKQTDLDTSALSDAMAPFFGVDHGQPCGFLASPAWQVVLQKEIDGGEGMAFYAPKPGVLYPAIYDLAERVLAAAKAARSFEQSEQHGWRDSLSGETEWLTDKADLLSIPAGKRKSRCDRDFKEGGHYETLWTKIADEKPAWAKKGEHLGALSAIKRLWPTLFAEEVAKALGLDKKAADRFVVSTHTMALVHQLDRWLEKSGLTAEDLNTNTAEPVALPRKLIIRHRDNPALNDARRLPYLLDAAAEWEDEQQAAMIREAVWRTLAMSVDDLKQRRRFRLETYYALLMMDGDRMGAILAGSEEAGTAISYRESFHPSVRQGFDQRAANQPLIQSYGQQKRAVSPNRHLAISGALNDFSQTVARHVVEEEHLGRVIYAGGDDVLAMLPVADLLSCMQRLRHVYSGTTPEDQGKDWGELQKLNRLVCKDGFAYLKGQLLRMMGGNATASCGAVIAHHQAPLSAVLRELRATEQRAKQEGGRDAFSLTVIKRSGGTLHLTAKWGEPILMLEQTIAFLAHEGVSRRAVYNSLVWLKDLPDPKSNPKMLERLLHYQLDRQADKDARSAHDIQALSGSLASLAGQQQNPLHWLTNFLTVAEFLAREIRTGGKA